MDTEPRFGDADGDPVESTAAVLKALADPTRLRIMWALSARERSVGELAELTGAHVAAISQHLSRLRATGLVTSRRDGTRIFYRPSTVAAREFLDEVILLASTVTEIAGVPAAAELGRQASGVRRSRAERADRAERLAAQR